MSNIDCFSSYKECAITGCNCTLIETVLIQRKVS